MKIMHRCARAKVLAGVAASAWLMLAIATPAAAESVRWRTVVGILQANNLVGNIAGGGQPWTTLGGHASGRVSRSCYHRLGPDHARRTPPGRWTSRRMSMRSSIISSASETRTRQKVFGLLSS
jgi:hypothetical protein